MNSNSSSTSLGNESSMFRTRAPQAGARKTTADPSLRLPHDRDAITGPRTRFAQDDNSVLIAAISCWTKGLCAEREGARGVEEFADGFLGARFGVDAQEGLGAAGAEQQPGFSGLGLSHGFGVV